MKRQEQNKSHNVALDQQRQAQSGRIPRVVSSARWRKTVAKVITVHRKALAGLADR